MTDKNVELALSKLEKAIKNLERAQSLVVSDDRSAQDSTIQRFEYTFELFWKALKKILSAQGYEEPNSPKQTLIKAYMSGYITDEKIWLDMLEDRNMSSHCYNEDIADNIFKHVRYMYTPFLRNSFEKLQKIVAQENV